MFEDLWRTALHAEFLRVRQENLKWNYTQFQKYAFLAHCSHKYIGKNERKK